jgi:hypothetical protein
MYSSPKAGSGTKLTPGHSRLFLPKCRAFPLTAVNIDSHNDIRARIQRDSNVGNVMQGNVVYDSFTL